MSLYWMVNGQCPDEVMVKLTKWAGIETLSFPRWRDTYCDSKRPLVYVYTRSGGANRQHYKKAIDACKMAPTFSQDKDDDNDNTYMMFTYRILPEHIVEWQKMMDKK